MQYLASIMASQAIIQIAGDANIVAVGITLAMKHINELHGQSSEADMRVELTYHLA